MAFVQIKKGPSGRPLTASVGVASLRVSARPKGEGKSSSIFLFPSVTLVEETLGIEINNAEISKAVANFAVQEGVGDDVGYWLMVHDPDGYAATLSKKGTHTLAMSIASAKLKHYVVDGTTHEPVNVEFAVDSERKEILFQVPEWIRFDPHSVYATVPSIKPESPGNRLNRHQRRRQHKVAAR